MYLPVLCEARSHDNSSNLPVVENLQHVPDSREHGTFRNNVGLLVLIALRKRITYYVSRSVTQYRVVWVGALVKMHNT
jgi:hypothetical protein